MSRGHGGWRLRELFEAPARKRPELPIRLDRPLPIEPSLGTDLRLDQLARLTIETADRLRRAGVGAGDRVAVLKSRSLDVCVLASALSRLGAVPALLSTDLAADTVGRLLERLRLPHVITDRQVREAGGLPEDELGELARSVITVGPGEFDVERPRAGAGVDFDLGEVSLITHTSGTTGLPKLVGYADRNIDAHTRIQVWATRALLMRERAAVYLSFVHGRMYSALAVCFERGFPMLVLTDPDPAVAGPLMAAERPGILETFPNVYLAWEQMIADPSGPLANVRYFISTFDAIHPRSVRALLGASRRRFPIYLQGYGTTETGPITLKVFTRSLAERGHGRCVGYPVPGYSRVRVKRRSGSGLGEIYGKVVGGSLLYVGQPERPAPRQDWWNTADIGYRSRWGCIHLMDRAVDEPPEVRSALLTEDELLQRLPEASEVIVLPVPEGLPRPIVCTPDGRPLPDEVWARAAGGRRLAAPIFCSWDSIPRTSTWKVRRLELRRQLEVGAFPAGAGAADGA